MPLHSRRTRLIVLAALVLAIAAAGAIPPLADRGPEIAATLAQTRIAIEQAGNAAEQIGQLAGELRNFGVDARTNEAVVTFDASLVRETGKQVDKRRFEARVPMTAITPTAAASAINQAANQVASEVADWIGR